MNLRLDNEREKNNKLKIIYIIIIVICILALIIAGVIQIFKNKPQKEPDVDTSVLQKYRDDFDKIFTNKVNYLKNNEYKIEKIDDSKQIVYTGYTNKDIKVSDYNLDVNIPYINIKNSVIEKFNKDIKDTFEQKAKDILSTQSKNIIYTVDYSAYVTNNMLSIVVRSTLKEGENPQRDIVQTYNYDLTNQKKITIDDMLELKGITKKEANQTIKQEIKTVQQKVEELGKLGYSVYARDYTSDMYSINNVTEFFMGENNVLYIIYAYGNQNNTSEMDVVVM